MPIGSFKQAIFGAAGAASSDVIVLLDTLTASGQASLAFESGIDATYNEYIFTF